jgi:serine-type D-Ala-D-Ala carboxypeptidase/endopeptidase (penicillin-binding protein 4)
VEQKYPTISVEKDNMLSLNFKLSVTKLTRRAQRNLLSAEKASRQSTVVWLLSVVALLIVAPAMASASEAPPFNSRLDAIIKREVPENVSISAQVIDLETGRVLMERDPDLALVPASTMKVVTTAAALRSLGPDFTFVTEVLADDVRGDSVGNIFLKGGGDPYLVSEELFALTRALRDKGLSEIRGNIVVDDSYFIPGQPLDENEKLGPRAYHAPYSALSLNFSDIKIVVQPGQRAGEPARFVADPVSEYAVVKGTVKTVKGDKPAQVTVTKETTDDGREIIVLDGVIGEASPTWNRYVNVASPALYTGEVFKEFLLREGIRVAGRVVNGLTPPSATIYHEHKSRPLGLIVYGLNKFSNNVMAEEICLALGAKVHGAPGTRAKGIAVSRKHLIDSGVPESNFALTEASGLSRSNRLSASALVKVLLAATRDFTYNAEFMASFGVAGVDGTLKEKFADAGARRRLRAKTGTLRGVNALAGYGISPDRRVYVFAVIANSSQKNATFIDYADKIARAILDMPLGKR